MTCIGLQTIGPSCDELPIIHYYICLLYTSLLHAGAQLVHHSLRQRWWIVNARLVIRSIIRKCVRCIRFSAKQQVQRLGILPSPRVTPSRPFLFCAVDYGGPFMIRHGGQKSRTLSKAYVSLFICLATRAIHLELVSDLTASAFIAALRRFMAHRGIPSQLYSCLLYTSRCV